MKWTGLLLLIPFFSFAQKWGKDTVLVYIDADLEITSEKKAAFYGVSVKVENGWMVYALYPDTTPVLRAYYKDKALKIKEGPYVVYFPKYQKAREGFYKDNNMTGIWRFWHENGQLKDSDRMDNNYLVGQWKSWDRQGHLLNAAQYKDELNAEEIDRLQLKQMATATPLTGIRTGAYTSWYSNGHVESKGVFNNNLMDGDWHWYHPNGNQSTVETYANGVVTGLQCFDTAGRALPDLCSIASPAQLKRYGNYKEFIYENLTWPEEARKKKLQGDVVVRFQVNRDGQLVNLVIKSDQPVLQKAVEELFGYMKEWYPAVSHNRIVVFEDEMVIPFRKPKDNSYNLHSSQHSY